MSTGVAVTGLDLGQVTLAWNSVPGATGYDIWRDGVKVASSLSPGYTDTGLMSRASYRYQIVATDGHANSEPVIVTIPGSAGLMYLLTVNNGSGDGWYLPPIDVGSK